MIPIFGAKREEPLQPFEERLHAILVRKKMGMGQPRVHRFHVIDTGDFDLKIEYLSNGDAGIIAKSSLKSARPNAILSGVDVFLCTQIISELNWSQPKGVSVTRDIAIRPAGTSEPLQFTYGFGDTESVGTKPHNLREFDRHMALLTLFPKK